MTRYLLKILVQYWQILDNLMLGQYWGNINTPMAGSTSPFAIIPNIVLVVGYCYLIKYECMCYLYELKNYKNCTKL